MSRSRLMLDALWPTFLLWLTLGVVALWRAETWPEGPDDWAQFLLIWLLVEFLTLKALLMARRMNDWVWLTASLIAANAAFALVYLSAMARYLWPSWYLRHLDSLRWSYYVLLVPVMFWGIWEIINVPRPAPLDEEE